MCITWGEHRRLGDLAQHGAGPGHSPSAGPAVHVPPEGRPRAGAAGLIQRAERRMGQRAHLLALSGRKSSRTSPQHGLCSQERTQPITALGAVRPPHTCRRVCPCPRTRCTDPQREPRGCPPCPVTLSTTRLGGKPCSAREAGQHYPRHYRQASGGGWRCPGRCRRAGNTALPGSQPRALSPATLLACCRWSSAIAVGRAGTECRSGEKGSRSQARRCSGAALPSPSTWRGS